MSATVVMPSIDLDTTIGCVATMRFVDPSAVPSSRHASALPDIVTVNGTDWAGGAPDTRLVVIYNTPEHNLGVGGSWNRGIEAMRDAEHDWLVILFAAVRFGEPGGLDFLRFLDEAGQAIPHPSCVEAGGGLGWHLLAFHRDTLDLVGGFDPIFWPGYYEDRDWSVRFQRAYGVNSKAPGFVGPLWPKVEVDASLTEVAHGLKRGGVHVDMTLMEQRFLAKWGEHEEYATPYDIPELDWRYTGPRPGTMA